jgi:hypothetical protein
VVASAPNDGGGQSRPRYLLFVSGPLVVLAAGFAAALVLVASWIWDAADGLSGSGWNEAHLRVARPDGGAGITRLLR